MHNCFATLCAHTQRILWLLSAKNKCARITRTYKRSAFLFRCSAHLQWQINKGRYANAFYGSVFRIQRLRPLITLRAKMCPAEQFTMCYSTYEKRGTVDRKPGSGRKPRIMTAQKVASLRRSVKNDSSHFSFRRALRSTCTYTLMTV